MHYDKDSVQDFCAQADCKSPGSGSPKKTGPGTPILLGIVRKKLLPIVFHKLIQHTDEKIDNYANLGSSADQARGCVSSAAVHV